MSRNNSGIKTSPGVVRLTWGIFDIAYVPFRLSVLPRLSIGAIHDACILTWYMFKLILEVYRSSGLNTILFILCHVWLCTSPAISLYLAFRTLQNVSLKGTLALAYTEARFSSTLRGLRRRSLDVTILTGSGRRAGF